MSNDINKNKFKTSHDRITGIREKFNEAHLLQKKIENIKADSSILQTLIKCNSVVEINGVVEEFFTPEERNKTVESHYHFMLEKLSVYKNLGISAIVTDGKDLFVEYESFHGHTSSVLCMVMIGKNKKNRKKYILKGSNLPPDTPVKKLEEQFLLTSNVNGISKFICSLHRYIWAFWKRESQYNELKTLNMLDTYLVYASRARTLITFRLGLMDNISVEIGLKYKALYTLPNEMTYDVCVDDDHLTDEHIDALKELKNSLLVYPAPDVLRTNIQQEMSTDAESNDSVRSGFLANLFDS